MRVREFERRLQALTPWNASEIDQRTRALREIGLLAVGGRGLNAPQINPDGAAYVVLSLAVTNRPDETHDAVSTYASMISAGDPRKAIGDTHVFFEALASILDAENKLRCTSVKICKSWPDATIEFKDQNGNIWSQRYLPPAQCAVSRRPDGVGKVREDITLDGHCFRKLAIDREDA